jgi:predicted TIM-barrel fold metal-dependent hydrolase
MAAETFPLIDCDIHVYPSKDNPIDPFVPAEFRQALAQGQGGKPGHGYSNPHGVDRRDVDISEPLPAIRQHLDRYGIAYGVLEPQPGYDVSLTHNIDVGNALARAWNDWQIETCLPFDERLLGSICVNLNDPAAAAAEIRRVGGNPRMVQTLGTGESVLLYGHRFYHPVYEACEEMGIVFALHPGAEGSLNSTTPIGRPSGYFEWHNSLPLTFQAHLNSLITEGAFEKFPKLMVLLVEGGVSWLAYLMWRMNKNFKALRVTAPWLRQSPGEYIFNHVRLTTQPIEEPENPNHLLQMFEMIKAERTLCFSTDFPHWDFDDPHRAFPSKTPLELRRRIQYSNAAELYGLPSIGETEARMRKTTGAAGGL